MMQRSERAERGEYAGWERCDTVVVESIDMKREDKEENWTGLHVGDRYAR